MLYPLVQCVSPLLPILGLAVRMDCLPNGTQTRTANTGEAEEVVEEMGDWPPAKMCMRREVSISHENPVGWHVRTTISLYVVAALVEGSRFRSCVLRHCVYG